MFARLPTRIFTIGFMLAGIATTSMAVDHSKPDGQENHMRNLASFAKEGKFLEVGSAANMGSVGAQRAPKGTQQDPSRREIDLNLPDEAAMNRLADQEKYGDQQQFRPPSESSFDPALNQYGDSQMMNSGCESETSCNSCLDVGGNQLTLPGQSLCVWCASSGSCIRRDGAFDLDRVAHDSPLPGTCTAGIATLPHHCGTVVNEITKHFERKADPVQVEAEKELAKTMPFVVKVSSPRQGEWVGHSEPADIALDGFFRAEEGKPTLVDICYSLFGPSSRGSPLIKRCRSIRDGRPLGNLSFPEPGPYTLNAWALDNVDDKLLSPMLTLDFDRLPSDLFEEGIFAIDAHAPGFPRTTEDSGLAGLILRTNQKVFGLSKDDTPLVYRPSGFEQGASIGRTTSRTIHTFWWEGQQGLLNAEKGKTAGSRTASPREKMLRGWTDSWLNMHANTRWTVRIWDRVSMEELAEREFGGVFYGLFARLQDTRDRERLSRYLALLHQGGVVAAPTVECFKPLDSLVVQAGVILVEDKKTGLITPDFMSSPPWHPLWWMVLHEIKRRVMALPLDGAERKNDTDTKSAAEFKDLTGDNMLTDVVKLYLELYPDTAIKVMGASDDVSTSDVIATGAPEEDGQSSCTDQGDCSNKYPNAFAIRHVVSSLLDERITTDATRRKHKAEL